MSNSTPLRILLAEDYAPLRTLYTTTLREYGAEVTPVGCGLTALGP